MATKEENVVEERPDYYEVYGAEIASRNRWFVITIVSLMTTAVAIAFAIMVRIQPPTLIQLKNGEATLIGSDVKGKVADSVSPGSDEISNEAFVQGFLSNYLNYTPSDIDEHWRIALNMMTKSLRAATKAALTAADDRGKIDREHIESDFHMRHFEKLPGERLSYVIYGVKDVHHLIDGNETTDHFVSEYRVELSTETRSKTNPNGLWIAAYSENPIEGEQKNQVLSAPNQPMSHP